MSKRLRRIKERTAGTGADSKGAATRNGSKQGGGVGKRQHGKDAKTEMTGKSGTTEKKLKGENFYLDKAKLARRKLLKSGKATRNAQGTIIKEADFAKRKPDAPVVRVEPNRKWFGNTRSLSTAHLETFREEMAKVRADPFRVLLRQSKLPLSLLKDIGSGGSRGGRLSGADLLAVESFAETFGGSKKRLRPRLKVDSLADLVEHVQQDQESYATARAAAKEAAGPALLDEAGREMDLGECAATQEELIFKKGQSKRIWNELYKVIDSSDVIIHVLDARNPEGTLCQRVETFLAKEAPHKHLIYLLNKADLVPTSVAAAWAKHLSARHPTLAFHASIQHPFGKAALLALLRQLANLHPDRPQISVGFIGYPNTGKSSVINALRKKKVCTVAPIPGETKVWQYVTLMKRIYLIDCPGIVPFDHEDCQTELVLKGAIRIENIAAPEDHIPGILARVKVTHLESKYGLPLSHLLTSCVVEEMPQQGSVSPDAEADANTTQTSPNPPLAATIPSEAFLTLLAKKSGKLLKGGEPDLPTVAKMVLNDWIRGELPFFSPVPSKRPSLGDSDECKA